MPSNHGFINTFCQNWLAAQLPRDDSTNNVKIYTLIRPGSADLVEIFMRQHKLGVYLANDTSCGVCYAPLSQLESTVLAVEKHLNATATKNAYPQIGRDIKKWQSA